MIVTVWINQVQDPHYGGHRAAERSELSVLDTLEGHQATVLTDCLADTGEPNVNIVRVESLGGNPYFDRWRHLQAWLEDCDDEWVWSVDANDVCLLNDPYPDWLDPDVLYVGSEPVDGPNARSCGFWWMTGLHPDHADWLNAHASLRLLNAGLIGGTPQVLREFVSDLTATFKNCPNDVTEMAAVNRVLYDQWTGRYVTGHPVHTPMWSFAASDPVALFAHK